MTDDSDITTTDEIDRTALEPVVREAVVVVGIVLLTFLGTFLPGTGRALPGTEITVGEVVIGLGTLGVVVSLLHGVPAVRDLVAAALDGPSEVAADVASIAGYAVAFLAVLIAHQGFAPALTHLVEVAWVYDAAFLLVALVPIGGIAYHFAAALDPLARFLTAAILGDCDSPGHDAGVGGENRS